MEYHNTKDILHVKQLLGYRRVENTLLYTQLVKLKGEANYVCKVARTSNETQDLIETGFEYICDHGDLKFFRKRK